MTDVFAVKRLILSKLVNQRIWGGKHTPLDFVTKGLPELFRMTHSGKKAIQAALRELQNEQLIILLQKRTGKGQDIHISLNPRKVAEIQGFFAMKQQ